MEPASEVAQIGPIWHGALIVGSALDALMVDMPVILGMIRHYAAGEQ
jgi:hypothetical protein